MGKFEIPKLVSWCASIKGKQFHVPKVEAYDVKVRNTYKLTKTVSFQVAKSHWYVVMHHIGFYIVAITYSSRLTGKKAYVNISV